MTEYITATGINQEYMTKYIIATDDKKPGINLTTMMATKYPDFTKPWRHSDIKFHVEGRPVHGNKTILSMWSPVFDAMFNDDFKEKTSHEIKLPGKHNNDILELFRVIHPPNKKIQGNAVYVLLPLAREYQMFVLTEKCEDYLVSLPPTMEHLIIAEEYNLPKLLDKCISFASNVKLCDLESRTEFKQLEQTTMIELLRRKIKTLETKQQALKTIQDISNGDRPHWRYDCLDESRGPHKQRSDVSCDACSYWICDEVRKKCRQVMDD